MRLFAKKCEYCGEKIEGDKNFCCEEHAREYEQEMEEYLKKSKKSGGCCG